MCLCFTGKVQQVSDVFVFNFSNSCPPVVDTDALLISTRCRLATFEKRLSLLLWAPNDFLKIYHFYDRNILESFPAECQK